MRQNLTNVKETQLDKVDSFYIVGSTTKEGLIEGRSNVKIDLKKAIVEGEGEGGGSSEDSALIKTLFGQTPYAVIMPEEQSGDPLPVVTLEEAIRTVEDAAAEGAAARIVYKEKEPKGKYFQAIFSYGTTTNASFTGSEPSVMVQFPQSMIQDGPWYIPMHGDVDLTEFPVPELGGGPVALTGVEIPSKDEIIIVYIVDGGVPGSKTLNKVSDEEFRAGGDILTKGSDGVWLWSIRMA